MRTPLINHHCRLAAPRRATTVLELIVAVGLLAVLLTTSMRMIRVISDQQRAIERRSLALQTVQGISEQVGNMPWEQLTAEAASQFAIPSTIAPHLPDAKLSVEVNDDTEPTAKRVTIAMTWKAAGGERAGPVRLTNWVFPEPSIVE